MPVSFDERVAAQFLDRGGAFFNAKHPDFGAVGDGVADDTAAVQAAIAAAQTASGLGATFEGAQVVMPPGNYLVSSALSVPMGVSLVGAGARSTRITCTEPSLNPVITSGVGGGAFLHHTQIKGMRVNANGAPIGLRLAGWNENCTLEDVHVSGASAEGVRMEAETPPTTRITQNTTFTRLRITDQAAGSYGLVLDNVRQCTFLGLSIDQPSNAPGAFLAGIKMLGGCNQNVFLNTHLEDCDVPVDIAEVSSCSANVFIGTDIQNPHFGPGDVTVGSETAKFAFLVRQGAIGYTLISYRNNVAAYDYDIYDVALGTALKFPSGSAIRFRQLYSVGDAGSLLATVAADSSAVPATGLNVVRVNTTGGNVTIRGMTGGAVGQRVSLVKVTTANTLTITHDDVLGTEKIITPDGSSIVLADYGGVELVYDGSLWFVVSAS
jgi:hypothetical protein